MHLRKGGRREDDVIASAWAGQPFLYLFVGSYLVAAAFYTQLCPDGGRGRQPTRRGCCSMTPYFTPVNKSHLSPEACRFPLNYYLGSLDCLPRQWLLLEHCTSRLVEASCLVCRICCIYSLPLVLGIVCASLIPTCLRICVCSIYLMALVASCGSLRVVLRLCRPDRLAKMRFRRDTVLSQKSVRAKRTSYHHPSIL